MMNLLMIYTCFAPENAIGSIRTTKLAKYLVRNGFNITLISPEIHEGMMLDDGLDCPELALIRRLYVPYGSWFRKGLLRRRNAEKVSSRGKAIDTSRSDGRMRESFRYRLKMKIRNVSSYPYTLLKNLSWFGQVKKVLNDMEGSFDIAMSSYPSISSHWSCGYARKIGLAKRWVADFRDPIIYEDSGWMKKIANTRILHKICHDADVITIISKAMADSFPPDRNRVKLHYLPNGFDPEDGLSLAGGDVKKFGSIRGPLTLVYTGGLYAGKRNLAPLFRAVSELVHEGSISENDFRFIYAGDEFSVLQKQATVYDCGWMLEDRGYINHQEAMRLQRDGDISVACTLNTTKDRGIITGKIYEYFQNARQVLAIVNGDKSGSELGSMIKETGSGFCFEEAAPDNEFERLKAYLLLMYEQKNNSGSVPDQRISGMLERFKYPSIAAELIGILSSI